MSHATYLVGDVFDRMAELPDGSVELARERIGELFLTVEG